MEAGVSWMEPRTWIVRRAERPRFCGPLGRFLARWRWARRIIEVGDVVTAAVWNTDIVDNFAALRREAEAREAAVLQAILDRQRP